MAPEETVRGQAPRLPGHRHGFASALDRARAAAKAAQTVKPEAPIKRITAGIVANLLVLARKLAGNRRFRVTSGDSSPKVLGRCAPSIIQFEIQSSHETLFLNAT